jgi:hypothetical protein
MEENIIDGIRLIHLGDIDPEPDHLLPPPMAGDVQSHNQIKNNILKRFYQILFDIIESEEEYKSKVSDFFQLEYQLQNVPQNVLENTNDYYTYAIVLFYILGLNSNENQFQMKNNHPISSNEIWLRYFSQLVMIKLDEKSGTLYQSPFDFNLGMIYLGKQVDETGKVLGYWVCMEERKSIKYLTSYYLSRSTSIHWHKDSIFPRKIRFPEYNFLQKDIIQQILRGNLSDGEMICKDGKVPISKSLLSLSSDYFYSLFNREQKYTFDLNLFEKETLIYYLYFCVKQYLYYFDPKQITEYLAFAEFIQDESFLCFLYDKIYENRVSYTNKTLLEFLKQNFQNKGFEISKY